MPDNTIVLSAHQLSKKYDVSKPGLFKKQGSGEAFWALQDVSFTLHKGQVLGIIGSNGAGKSTLLKILAEVIPPTGGHVEYSGAIVSILEIGTGFHPDLSGYENIFLNASMLGMKKKQVRAKLDEIIEFSGIEAHIHEPVRTYSSGMYLRLALSIALFTESEIVLLDEVVSVGDEAFRMKATQKIKDEAQKGKAFMMISHDLSSVLQLCDSSLLLEKGKVIYSGRSRETVEDYFDTIYRHLHLEDASATDHPVCSFIGMIAEKEKFYMDEPVRLKIKYEVKQEADVRIVLTVRTYQALAMSDSACFRPDYETRPLAPGIYETTCIIPANLFNAGVYLVDLIVGSEFTMFADVRLAGKFKVALLEWEAGKNWNESGEVPPFRPYCSWETQPLNRLAGK